MALHIRHGGMAMAMGSATDSMTDMATPTSSASPSSTMDMSGMDMGDMTMVMQMSFTTNYEGVPVLFSSLVANSDAKAFGLFMFLFFLAFVLRSIEFLRLYLETKVWNNPAYAGTFAPLHAGELRASVNLANKYASSTGQADELLIEKHFDSQVVAEAPQASTNPHKLRLASSLFRDLIRLILCFLPDMFSFGLMLGVMSFNVIYFFGVVTGLGLGRFFFEKLAEHYGIRNTSRGLGTAHCG